MVYSLQYIVLPTVDLAGYFNQSHKISHAMASL